MMAMQTTHTHAYTDTHKLQRYSANRPNQTKPTNQPTSQIQTQSLTHRESAGRGTSPPAPPHPHRWRRRLAAHPRPRHPPPRQPRRTPCASAQWRGAQRPQQHPQRLRPRRRAGWRRAGGSAWQTARSNGWCGQGGRAPQRRWRHLGVGGWRWGGFVGAFMRLNDR